MSEMASLLQKVTVLDSETRLLVFVSSVLDMTEERRAVHDAVDTLSLTVPWLFEATSASSLPLEESYLSKVRVCDVFVLLLDTRYSEPVQAEYREAVKHNKPILAFVRRGRQRPLDLQKFVDSLSAKYREYDSVDELRAAVGTALKDEIIRQFRQSRQPENAGRIAEIVRPHSEVRKIEDTLAYIILGVKEELRDNPFMVELMKLFGAELVSAPTWKVDSPFPVAEVAFRSLADTQSALTLLVETIRSAAESGAERSESFFAALNKTLVPRLAQLAVSRAIDGQPGNAISASEYVVLGVREDYAPYFKIMRMAIYLDDQISPAPGTTLVLFRNLKGLQAWSEMMGKITQGPQDKEAIIRTVTEAALRYAMTDLTSRALKE